MADLIHKSAAIDICEVCREAGDGDLRTAIYRISKLPAVDAVEVVHGYWTTTDTIFGQCCVCSACGSCPTMEYKYCPYCGAKMDGERREENAGKAD